MQTLAKNARHVAEWGHYQIVVDNRGGKVRASIRDLDVEGEQIVFMSELPVRTDVQAVEWAGIWLEEHGCKAFVDGQKRRIADFLIFMPDGAL
jgi:hypothetical protein